MRVRTAAVTLAAALAAPLLMAGPAQAAEGDYVEILTERAQAGEGRFPYQNTIPVTAEYRCSGGVDGAVNFVQVQAHQRGGFDAICDGTVRSGTYQTVYADQRMAPVTANLWVGEQILATDTEEVLVLGGWNQDAPGIRKQACRVGWDKATAKELCG